MSGAPPVVGDLGVRGTMMFVIATFGGVALVFVVFAIGGAFYNMM